MRRNNLAAVAAVAALGVAGCGGGSSSNKALSYGALGSKTNAICKDVSAQVNPQTAKLTGDPAADSKVLTEVVDKIKAASKKIKALKPPKALKADFDRFTALTDQQIGQEEKALQAAKAGDKAGYVTALQGIKPINVQSKLAASKLGAGDCAK